MEKYVETQQIILIYYCLWKVLPPNAGPAEVWAICGAGETCAICSISAGAGAAYS